MFEKLENCPLCHSGLFTNQLICKDHTVSQEEFAIVKCQKCNFHFTNPRPHEAVIGQYYESEDYISHQNKSNSLINIAYQIARYFTLKRKVRLINKQSASKGYLLDIGCGTGHFLAAAQKDGWSVIGVEPNQKARKQAVDRQLHIEDSLSSLTSEHSYDVITLWHVLEHMPHLNETVSRIQQLLSKKGTLIVAVPNHRSYDAKAFDRFWAAYDVPRHLYHFDHDSVKALMKKHKLKVKKILPMKLDAYYVSILSNKYKHNGDNNLINSFITAYKSNIYAKKNSPNYSSNIYIISK